MTIDQFILEHEPTWNRLGTTTYKMRDAKSEVDFIQFSADLEAVQTHLNIARTHFNDDELINRLSTLCAHAGRAVHRGEPLSTQAIKRWFLESFPAAFWSLRYWILLATVVFIATAVLSGLWANSSTDVLDAFMIKPLREEYVRHDFVEYYTNDESPLFFAKVTTNNIGIAFLCFGAGMLFVLPSVLVLVSNAFQLGAAWAVFAEVDQTSTFWLHIAPHGFMELFAIFVAAGMGMALGWTWIDPGPRSRGEAFADVGSRTVTVTIGVALMLVISGLIEGFITGSGLPLWFKAAFGFLVWVFFTGVTLYLGWNAARRGLTGSLKQAQRVEFSAPATTIYTRY